MEPDSILLGTESEKWAVYFLNRRIYKLDEKTSKYFTDMGHSALNRDVLMCIQTALNHEPNFWNRVYGYKINKDSEDAKKLTESLGVEYIDVHFYEINKNEHYEFDKHVDWNTYNSLEDKGEKALEFASEAAAALKAKRIVNQFYLNDDISDSPICIKCKMSGAMRILA